MTRQKYPFQEAIQRILLVFKGSPPADDTPGGLWGENQPWNISLSDLAELLQGSLPNENFHLPGAIMDGDFLAEGNLVTEADLLVSGTSTFYGNVTLSGDGTSWGDMVTPLTRTQQGANNKPDFDTGRIGLLFPGGGDTSEKVYLTFQFQHNKKMNTFISPHVHYVQGVTGTPIFEYYYKWYSPGAIIPHTGTWSTGTTAAGSRAVFSYGTGTAASGTIMQIAEFPDVPYPAGLTEGVSSHFDMILWRNDSVVSGDVLVKSVDLHYEIDAFGSDDEYTK